MLSTYGFGLHIFKFGLLCAAIFFVLAFVFVKFVLKKSMSWTVVASVVSGILGFLASPYLFYYFIFSN